MLKKRVLPISFPHLPVCKKMQGRYNNLTMSFFEAETEQKVSKWNSGVDRVKIVACNIHDTHHCFGT